MNIDPIPGEPNRYYVQSRTHKEVIHIVDVEDQECSCEGFGFRKKCSHLDSVNKILEWIKQQEQELVT